MFMVFFYSTDIFRCYVSSGVSRVWACTREERNKTDPRNLRDTRYNADSPHAVTCTPRAHHLVFARRNYVMVKIKVKVTPRTGHEGPESE